MKRIVLFVNIYVYLSLYVIYSNDTTNIDIFDNFLDV